MEEKRKVKPYKVVYICDRCKSGEMTPTGQVFNLGKPQIEHVCPVCGFRKSFTDKYPKIEFREIKSRKIEEE